MENFMMNFSEQSFSKLFPFYILLDESLTVTSFGRSVQKLYPGLETGITFNDCFRIKRPFIDKLSAKQLVATLGQLAIIECKKQSDATMRGQFEMVGNFFVFVGSPWFTSLEEVNNKNLSIFDFASHDPMLDLLQLLKMKERNTSELRDLLKVIYDQKEQLKSDKEELNKLSVVASANKNGVVFTDAGARIFWCNDAYVNITGYSREELMGKTPVEVGKVANTDSESLRNMVSSFYKGEPFDVEIAHGRKDGSFLWTRTKGQPIYDENGKLLQYFAIIEDMTEERKRDEQIKLLSQIAEKNINAVVICDKHGAITWVNKSFEQMSGYSLEELKGEKPGKLLQGPNSDYAAVHYLGRQIKMGEPFNCEILNYSKNGKEYWVKITGQPIYDKFGEVSCFFAIEEDVTNKRLLQSQKEELMISLEKSNRELEDYAQIVSHDLKSPLRSISSLIAWIKEENPEFSVDTKGYFNLIDDKLEKMDHLIEGVLTYSKIDRTDIAKEKVNLQDVVSNILKIIHIPANIKVAIVGTLPTMRADRFRMQQLFQNLIGNAVAYIDKPMGLVEISAQEFDNHYIFTVSDNGPGIAKENQEKIFRVFQSLNKSDKSTGLGLSIVKKIVENYKGEIWLESEIKKGTTFFIKLNKE